MLRALLPRRRRPHECLRRLVWRRTGGEVIDGPLKGLKLTPELHRIHTAYLLGTYEREIAGPIEDICELDRPLVIDVGSSFGYYAVGIPRRNGTAEVIAYEMMPEARELLTGMIEANGVGERVEVRGECRRADLQADLERSAPARVVICDCEGAEIMLLDPLRVPGLAAAHVLVEVHEFLLPGLTDELRDRFEPTHRVERIDARPNPASAFPYDGGWVRWLPDASRIWAVSDQRDMNSCWLWMTPRDESQ
jgi:hypothetical protein